MNPTRLVAFLLLGASGLAVGDAPSQAQQPMECRTAQTDSGPRQSLCGPRPAQAASKPAPGIGTAAEAFPPDFRGRISYSGTYEGRVANRGRPLRRLDVRSIIASATSGNSRGYAGGYTVEMEINGNAVTGRYSGTGGIDRGTFSGTRSGSNCRLFDDRSASATVAECTPTRFTGNVRSAEGSNPSFRISFETHATALVDANVEEERRRIAEAQAAERARAAAAAYTALPDAGPALTRRLDSLAQTDSRGWAFNRYDSGSMTSVKIIEGSRSSGNFVMQGYYTYNGGSRGWVMAKMAGGQLECIQFWDSVVGCRGLRTAEQGQAMRDAAFGVIAGGMSSDSSGQSRDYPDSCQLVVTGTNAAGGAVYGSRC
ncbi:MAG TPA: hypothetical protein VEW25_10735 [Allosphingosinicella sp.]|nr:hypothetical protein [Allosphingosinicella sp.]